MNILTLLQERSYGWLALILFLIYVAWLIYFKLSFKIINEKMPPAIYLAVFLMVSYVFGARPFISHLFFVIGMGVFMVILLCILGRLNIFKAIYASVLSIFISFLGDIFLLFVALGLSPKLFPYLFGSKWGSIIIIGVEVLIPIIALFITNPKFSLRLPLRKKTDPFDLFDMGVSWTLISMYYVMDYALNAAFEAFQNNSQKIGSSLGFMFMTTFGIMGGVMIIIKCMKIMHDRDIKKLQEEKEMVERENEIIETEKNLAVEKMHNVFEFNRSLDPQMKEILVDSLVKVAERWAGKPAANQQPAFTINYPNIALHGLKERDAMICGHLILNKTNQEIADELKLSAGHVANTISEMIQKFDLNDRYELARFALNNCLVEIPKE